MNIGFCQHMALIALKETRLFLFHDKLAASSVQNNHIPKEMALLLTVNECTVIFFFHLFQRETTCEFMFASLSYETL